MFIIFALLIENISFFNGMFPSFGLLFLTLKKAKTDMAIMMIYILLLLLGFATWANTLNGTVNSDFSEYGSSIIFLLHDVSTIIINFFYNYDKASFIKIISS